jgi:hypothetical protein
MVQKIAVSPEARGTAARTSHDHLAVSPILHITMMAANSPKHAILDRNRPPLPPDAESRPHTLGRTPPRSMH